MRRALAPCVMRGVLAAGLTICMVPSASAYETRTHQKLTMRAVELSVLADVTQGPLAALGIEDLGHKLRSIPPSGVGEIVPATELVGLGAIYEDEPLLEGRFLKHFYDPQIDGDKGLFGNLSSMQWVLESEGDIPQQQFSLRDAHQFYVNALTYRDTQARERNLTLLLQTLGRAVHHLQDMSQPAHVRNDAHPLGLDGDVYEKYTNTQFVKDKRSLPAALPCGEAAIDLRQFDTAEKFWSHAGRGIAEFTSHNFVSFDTNFRSVAPGVSAADPDHALPAFPASPVFQTVDVQELGLLGPATTRMVVMGLPITDANSSGGCFNARAVTQSFASIASPLFPSYSLNSVNFEANYPILFPRALAYSAGLIDYFFRGRLRLESYSVTGGSVQIVVRNLSAAEFALAEMPEASGEEFSVYYDAPDGERRRLALRGDDLAGDVIGYGQTVELSFTLPLDIDGAREHPFTLVFNGRVGNEQAIAAIPVGPPKEGAFLVTPSYLPSDGIAGARVIAAGEAGWQVSSDAGAVAGNIDWRGHHPEDVLTWHGPQGRYFGAPVGKSPNIYRAGKLLTAAPGNVIGAAISARGSQRYLIAAVLQFDSVKIYRRPFQLSYKRDGLYDPLNNPLGWQAIGGIGSGISSPLFFNASGTEGQVFIGEGQRVKINIAGATVAATTIANSGSYRTHRTFSSTAHSSVDVEPEPQSFCEARGFECVGGTGSCTQPDGSTITKECLMIRAQERATYGHTGGHTVVGVTVQAAVVCADYHGDAEVLCTLELEEDAGVRTFAISGEKGGTRIHTVNQSTCGDVRSGPRMFRERYEWQDGSRGVMRLRVGSRSIRLSGTEWRQRMEHSVDNSWDFSEPEPQRTIDYRFERANVQYDSRLLYVDARYDIIAYEDHTTSSTVDVAGSAPAVFNEETGGTSIYVDGSDIERRDSRLVVLADREYVLSTHVEQDPPQPYVALAIEFWDPKNEECEMPTGKSGQEDRAFPHDIYGFPGSIHPKIKDEPEQLSLSALSQGVFVASVPIWIRQADGSYQQQGTWNHISNGSLSTLLPSSALPQAPSYAPTGILK